MREVSRRRRANETPDQYKERIDKMRERSRIKRAFESPEQYQSRIEKMRIRSKQKATGDAAERKRGRIKLESSQDSSEFSETNSNSDRISLNDSSWDQQSLEYMIN
jgi:hypothetical protein